MTRTLILMRHARQQGSGPDHERELTDEGRVAAGEVGQWLTAAVGVPDLVITSTAVRARQTWAAMTGEPALAAVPTWTDRRIYLDGPAGLLAAVSEAPDNAGTVLVVGHAPGVPSLAVALSDPAAPGHDAQAWAGLHESCPPLTAAVVEFDGKWGDLGPEAARLRAVHTPG